MSFLWKDAMQDGREIPSPMWRAFPSHHVASPPRRPAAPSIFLRLSLRAFLGSTTQPRITSSSLTWGPEELVVSQLVFVPHQPRPARTTAHRSTHVASNTTQFGSWRRTRGSKLCDWPGDSFPIGTNDEHIYRRTPGFQHRRYSHLVFSYSSGESTNSEETATS